ncbi:DUF2892 domain-containing protein [Aquimarina hainanensis]|uniref:DUF2892 domain-containing protein n=1 Tax=Aquimarina hainanensis TaxID=1578017 RepID=A0ABW5NAE4_9FLAO
MKKNMGGLDRIIRFTVAIVINILFYMGVIQGVLAYVLLGLSGVFVFTSITGFCLLYVIIGINTYKMKKRSF